MIVEIQGVQKDEAGNAIAYTLVLFKTLNAMQGLHEMSSSIVRKI